MRKYRLVFSLLALSTLLQAQTWSPTWASLDQRPVPQWYKDAKFGIFIHWGVYSVPGWSSKGQYAEWYQQGLNSGDTARIHYHKKKFGDLSYYQLADQFKAELYNPDEWAHVIESSGARYVVLTSKHHDGFANWPSKENAKAWTMPWNAGVTGPHRDLLGDLFTAIRKTSVHPGMYYSLYEWYNPIWQKDRSAYVSGYMWPQMKDLINTYQPEVFWTDGDWDAKDSLWKSTEFLAWLYNESPVKDKIVTYDRWGAGIRFHHGGVYTPEYQPNADFEDHYWEESRGMGFSYGYNREEDAWDYNSAQSLVLQLIDKVSRGGNFLLDIGPDEHGKIPPIMEERLMQIGDWMKINNEAIYGTTRWRQASQWGTGRQDYVPGSTSGDLLLKLTVDPDPGFAVKECFFTYNPVHNDLYAILPRWPATSSSSSPITQNAQFTIQNLPLAPGTRIELLETHQTLSWQASGKDLVISMPAFDPARMKSNYAYVIKIAGAGSFAAKPSVDLSYPAGTLTPLVTIQPREGVEYHYTLDGTAPTALSPVYTRPFTIQKSATLTVKGLRPNALPGIDLVIPVQVFDWMPAARPGKTMPGLEYTAYEWTTGSAHSVNELSTMQPVRSGGAASISSAGLTRKENAGIVYGGYIKVPADAIYTFYLSSDDGSRLLLDGQQVIDNDGLHGQDEKSFRIPLRKGFHAITLQYFNGTGDGALRLSLSSEGHARQPVPDSYFYQSSK